MEIDDLGARLRQRRMAAGRTIASVAADAGLSVPYIANLENGRGNPTLSAVNRIVTALGARLAMMEGEREPSVERTPEALVRFAHTPRFAAETARLARTADLPEALIRQRLLHAMSAMSALTTRPMSDLGWHRILDTAVLITRPED